MPGEVAPFPWDRLGSASLDESAAAAWAAATAWPGDGVLGSLTWRGAIRLDAAAARARAGEPSAAVVTVRRGPRAALVVVPWRSWRALADQVLGADPELAAPRPPTPAERGFAALAVADAVERAGVDAGVELDHAAPAGAALAVTVAVTRPIAAELTVLVPAPVPWPSPAALAALVVERGDRLPPVPIVIELARGWLTGAALAGAAAGDVVVVGRRAPAVRVARGRIAVALDEAASRITVGATYQRMDPMTQPPSPASADQLADDLRVPLTVVIADLELPARTLLEMVPGQVVSLGRPVGDTVELRSGGRCVARGQLVTVDGELGVRIATLADRPAGPLVDGAGTVVGPAPR